MNAANYIVIAVILILVIIICYPLIKRMRAKEDCCGNEKVKINRKKLKHPAGKYKLAIEGMHCTNCVRRITEAVNGMDGLACKVSLEKGEAVVSYERQPGEDEIIRMLGEMGFRAYSIKE